MLQPRVEGGGSHGLVRWTDAASAANRAQRRHYVRHVRGHSAPVQHTRLSRQHCMQSTKKKERKKKKKKNTERGV